MRPPFPTRALGVLFLLATAACVNAASEKKEPGMEPLSTFPRSELVLHSKSGQHVVKLWIADTPQRQRQGLMFVEKLEPGTGMLFLYPGEPRPLGMWMKNTLIPLDMLFISKDGRIARIARETRPHSLETISSLMPVSAVLEIGGGEAGRLGIEVGDRVAHAAFR
jgi:uncharacterized protein